MRIDLSIRSALSRPDMAYWQQTGQARLFANTSRVSIAQNYTAPMSQTMAATTAGAGCPCTIST
jgi:hypothetical protein